MNAIISHANPPRARYALQFAKGGYTLFETLDGVLLEVGDVVKASDFELPGKHVFWIEGDGSAYVWVDAVHMPRNSARPWVAAG
jgi:hypothetical protein